MAELNKDEIKGLLFKIFELGFHMRGWTGNYKWFPVKTGRSSSEYPEIIFLDGTKKPYTVCCKEGILISREILLEEKLFEHLISFNEFLEKLSPEALTYYNEMCTSDKINIRQEMEYLNTGMSYCYITSLRLIHTAIRYSKSTLEKNIFQVETFDIENMVICG